METTSIEEGVGPAVLTWMRRAICGLHGHDSLLHFEHDRMSLRCVSCGYESPGWEIADRPKDTPVAATVATSVPRRSWLRPHLVGARRVA